MQFLKHSVEWLMLVGPAALLSGAMAWWLRNWFKRSLLYFLLAWLGGAVLLAFASFVTIFVFSSILNGRLAQCLEGPEYYLCKQHLHIIGYPIVISLITVGLYLLGPIVWKIFTGVRRHNNAGVSQ